MDTLEFGGPMHSNMDVGEGVQDLFDVFPEDGRPLPLEGLGVGLAVDGRAEVQSE